MNIFRFFRWSRFQLARSSKYLTKSLKHWGKQPQRLCITKRGRPTLPSSTRLARPPAPTTPEAATDAAADVGVDFEVVCFESPNIERPVELSETIQILCWALPNGSERFRGTSERFRTVQRPPLSVYEWFTCGLRAGSGLLGPLGVFCRGTGFRSPKFGWWVTDWCNQVTTSNFLTNSPDQKFVWICKKVMLLWGNFV